VWEGNSLCHNQIYSVPQKIQPIRLQESGCIFDVIIHQIFSLARDWSKHVTWPNIPQLKLGNIREYSPIFKTARVAKKIWRKINSLHFGWKYARIFVLGHYLFLEAHSFPWATLSENCSLLGTNNVRGQISERIFAPNEGYCLCITSNFPIVRHAYVS